MKAAVFHATNQPLVIEDVEIDAPMANEIVVRNAFSGVCHSDLHYIEGLYPARAPAILGHETAGVVEAVGDQVTYVKPGDHVIACLSVFCGLCENCMRGRPVLCLNPAAADRTADDRPKYTLRGETVNQWFHISSFAEKMLLHQNTVVKIREDFPLDLAALIGCGVMTGVGAVLNTAKVEPGSTVAVFGCGGVGLSAIQGARIAGARMIIAVDTLENKLALARELGATHVVDASTADNVARRVREVSGGGVDYSFEAIGNAKVAEQCFDALARGGTATVIGMIPVGHKVELTGSALLMEKKIQGSAMGSNRFRIDMPRLIEFNLQGRLKLDEMITRRLRLEDVNEAFRAMKAGEVARSILAFD